MMILFSDSLASLSSPYAGGLTVLSWFFLQTPVIKNLEPTVFKNDRQETLSGNHFLLVTAQPGDSV